jgi:Flp pilus assembly protein TadG
MLRPTTHRNGFSNQRGAVTFEFTLAMVLVLFPLMFGILDFSRAAYAYHWVSYAAREGTRWASVRGAACLLLSGGCPAAATDIQTFIQSIAPPGMYTATCSGNNAGCISINTTSSFVWPGKGGDGNDCTNGGVLATNSPGCIVKVQVNYYFGFTLPYLGPVVGTTIKLQSTSQMVISQ